MLLRICQGQIVLDRFTGLCIHNLDIWRETAPVDETKHVVTTFPVDISRGPQRQFQSPLLNPEVILPIPFF